MKITLLVIGNTEQAYLREGIQMYQNRLKHYVDFRMLHVDFPRRNFSGNAEVVKKKEAELIKKQIEGFDCVVLLDEKGQELSSRGFSEFMQKRLNAGTRGIVFVVGGAWGFHEEVKALAHHTISLSRMTFSHEMVRLFFVEQLYRAFTILKGESYHND